MLKTQNVLLMLLCLLPIVLLTGCGQKQNTPTPVPPTPKNLVRIVVTPEAAILGTGETKAFIATGYDENNNIMHIVPAWNVSGNVGTSDSAGIFYAQTRGRSKIFASSNKISGESQITVLSKETGSIIIYIQTVSNNFPAKLSHAYVDPTSLELNLFSSIASNIITGEIFAAMISAESLNYGLNLFEDGGQKYYVLFEDNNPVTKGWGAYIFNPFATTEVVVEAPHPKSDTTTESIAVQIYKNQNSKWFLMAGSYRDSSTNTYDGEPTSDVAHNPDTVFEKINEAAVNSQSKVIQIHGFVSSSHPSYYPYIVLSRGTTESYTILNDLITKLVTGLKTYYSTVSDEAIAGIFGDNYYADHLDDLGATQNVQGKYVRGANAWFCHMELERTKIRLDDTARGIFIDSVVDYFNK